MDAVFLDVAGHGRPENFNPLYTAAPDMVEQWLNAPAQTEYVHTYTVFVGELKDFVPATEYLKKEKTHHGQAPGEDL
jgi:hypothetical protein